MSRHAAREATEGYYNAHAQRYVDTTLRIDMSELYEPFLALVPRGGRILDAGSGSGRDTLAFFEKGYRVEAFDASPALAEISSRVTGVPTRVLRFQDFQSTPRFDAIWACASLLHVPLSEWPDALRRLIDALKPGGTLFISVKHGIGERLARDGRLFTDLDEKTMRSLLARCPVAITKLWISEGQGSRRGEEQWLNVLAVKTAERRHDG
jgi:SAM-dependent methyltransferase